MHAPGAWGSTALGRGSVLALLALAVALGWILLMPASPLAQPALFNHARHRAIACATCHSGVETSAHAGLPGLDVCLKCHATPPPGTTAAQWQPAGRAGGIRWIQVTRLPDHVMFSHRRHVAIARLECASCHADIGARTAPPGNPPVRLDMNGCLSCHRREGASEDCDGCHR